MEFLKKWGPLAVLILGVSGYYLYLTDSKALSAVKFPDVTYTSGSGGSAQAEAPVAAEPSTPAPAPATPPSPAPAGGVSFKD